jgi:hypothetical protein
MSTGRGIIAAYTVSWNAFWRQGIGAYRVGEKIPRKSSK